MAVVNLDEPVGQGAAQISAGAGVVDSLVASKALDFHVVHSDDAERGLAHGDYYFVIEIPKYFSSEISRIGSTTTAPALINVTYNDNTTIMASNIGARAMSAIDAAVLKGTATSTVGQVLVGVDALGSGLRAASAGSTELHLGTVDLAAGADQLSDGLNGQLAPGISQAAEGSRMLADGADQLSTGATQLQDGTTTLGSGAQQLASGIDQLVGTVNPAALQTVINQFEALAPNTGPAALELTTQIAQVQLLVEGLNQLRSGSQELARQLTDPAADYRSGIDQITSGARELDTGARELSNGMDQLESGAMQAAAGAQQLQSGSRQIESGAGELATKLGEGAQLAPDLGSTEHQATLAELLSTPVQSSSKNLTPAQDNGPGGAPVLLTIGSALVALVVFMCFRAHDFAADITAPLTARQWWRRAAQVSAVSLAGVAVVSTVLWQSFAPHPTPASMLEVIAVTAVTTIMNVAMVALLFTVLGYAAGALASLAWIMLQIFAFGGVWMVETLPVPLQLLHPVAPMTYVRDGMIAAFNDAAGFWPSILIMTMITGGAAALALVVRSHGWSRYPHVVTHSAADAPYSGTA